MLKTHLTFSAGVLLVAALVTGCSSPAQLGQRVTDNALRRAAGSPDPAQPLRESMTFAATFDNGLDADFAKGDAKLYSAPKSSARAKATPGLPEGDLVKRVEGAGVHGAALEFTKKMDPVLFYRGGTNLAVRTNWSGTASFWLKLDPDKDLAPGYCDPVQFVGQTWTNGAMFVEFSKDHTPRNFRFAIMAKHNLWNPTGKKWEEIPDADRPMVQVKQPGFSREKWTHVVFTFKYANTGRKDGIGKLYMDGELKGTFTGFDNTLVWDPVENYLNLGLAYVGMIDEISVFDRALSAQEVQILNHLPRGLHNLLYRESGSPLIGERKWLTKDNHFK